MNRFYLVAISSTRYRIIEAFTGTLAEAAERCIDAYSSSFAIVLRDGANGRRYSQHEAGALIGLTSWQCLMRSERRRMVAPRRRLRRAAA